jgi:hypothetical protein
MVLTPMHGSKKPQLRLVGSTTAFYVTRRHGPKHRNAIPGQRVDRVLRRLCCCLHRQPGPRRHTSVLEAAEACLYNRRRTES